jgi:protein arginine kinase activator
MYDKVCPVCGRRLSEFYNTSMLGCPACYSAFEREIVLALKKIQGKQLHVGKTPEGTALDRELLSEYQRLIKEKERANIEGRFNDMCDLNEDILSLKAELKKRGLI